MLGYLLFLTSTLILTAGFIGTPRPVSFSTRLMINTLLFVIVGYLMIALGFWLARLISKRLMVKP